MDVDFLPEDGNDVIGRSRRCHLSEWKVGLGSGVGCIEVMDWAFV
jgi:hypothetical protein